MTATIKDIARETGLGLATISSYLNGGNVREKNRQKIEAAIKKYNFAVNEVARGLKTNRTKTIGVLIPELRSAFSTEIITGMDDIFRHSGYAVITCDCRTDAGREKDAVNFLLQKRVDGIVNMPVSEDGAHLQPVLAAGKPVVLIDRPIQGLDCDSVLVDNVDAARIAVEELLRAGHKHIGLLGGPAGVFTAEQRALGYYAALEAAHIQPDPRLLVCSDYTICGGRDGLTLLLDRNPAMTAAVVVNYEMTVGAMIAVGEHNLRIPADLSLIGFDNAEFARACQPKLTIVTQPTHEIAIETARLMLARLQGNGPAAAVAKKLKASLVRGCSVTQHLAEQER